MLFKLLGFIFTKLIGKVPENKREGLKKEFTKLSTELVKALAEGTAKGVTGGFKKNTNT